MKLIVRSYRAWMRAMRLFGDIMSRIILTVIYLVMALPLGLVAQRFSDPLQRRGGPRWHPIDPARESTDRSRSQY